MKLKKLEKNKYKKLLFLVIFGIVFICVGVLIDKTFSMYQVSKSFEFVNGKVNYYGHSDVYFAYYNGITWLEDIPKKNNADNLVYDHAECDNEAIVEWDEEEWTPKVKNLTKAKTRCSLYFKVEKDTTVPEITMLKTGNYDYADNISTIATAKFGRLGGTLECKVTSYNNKVVSKISDINILGKHTVECTATGNNGLKTTKQETYTINAIFTYNNGLNCTGNCKKSYDHIYLQNGMRQYGPYVAMKKGCYHILYYGLYVSYIFNNLEIQSTNDNWVGEVTKLNYIYSDLNYYANIPKDMRDVEFIATNNSTYIVGIYQVEVNYAGETCST